MGERSVLGPLNFQLHDGEWVALTGGNGSGKSTLCRIVAGLSEPAEGNISVTSESSGLVVPTGIAMLLSRLGEWKQKTRAGKPEEKSTQGSLFAFP